MPSHTSAQPPHITQRSALRPALCALVVFLGLGLSACSDNTVRAQPTTRVDLDQDDSVGGIGTESGDIRAMSDQFVRTMLTIPEITNATSAPRVALVSVRNRVDDVTLRFDSEILLMRMRAELNRSARGQMRFLARNDEMMDAIESERENMDAGTVTRSSTKALSGADYFMTGEIRSLTKNTAAGKSAYMLYAFQLVDSQSSEIVWEDLYESKRQALRGTVDR